MTALLTAKCLVDTCDRAPRGRGWCPMHYKRWKKHGDPEFVATPHAERKCSVDDCDRKHYALSWCFAHYQRQRRTGDVDPDTALREWAASEGYRTIRIDGHSILEHRHIMEQRVGRPLLPEETVHHKNGQRWDNRIENLELWSHSHPKGQRIEDKVEWAKELLRTYDPAALALD